MNNYGCLIRIAASYFLYMFLGTIALTVITVCCATILSLQNLQISGNVEMVLEELMSMEAPEFIATLQNILLDKLPLGDIIEASAGAGGFSIGTMAAFIRGDSFSISNLLLDMVTATVAGTIIYLFNRINVSLSSLLPGADFQIVLCITSMVWSICGFSIALTIIQAVDTFIVVPKANIVAKVTLSIISLLIHGMCLSDKIAKNVFIKSSLLFLLKKLFRDLFNSILIAYVCSKLHGLYDYSAYHSFMIAAAIATIGLAVQSLDVRAKKERLGI